MLFGTRFADRTFSKKPTAAAVRTPELRGSTGRRSSRSTLKDSNDGWKGCGRSLVSGRYVPKPLLRVWIPKSNGGQRPLGIPCISDRVVQMAAVLIIGPIFEADLLSQQYGFRPGLDAKMALRRVYWHVTQHGRREVVDADLRGYFTSIPHSPLVRSLCRRIADGRMLHVIKGWLTAPVVEVIDGRPVQTTEARRTKRGTPQGGVISPLLANLYFRRFLLAWHNHGHRDQLDAHVVTMPTISSSAAAPAMPGRR